jgi:cytochrome c-type biogenesis protein CcmH/NrfG
VKRWIGVAVAVLTLAGCKSPAPRPAAPALSMTAEQLAAAVALDAQRSDLETDPKVRDQLAADALQNAQACLERAPQAAACLYYDGVALGLKARAHPLQANEALKSMLDALSSAEAADPAYDQAGPERVKALVLIKAPGWPLGPGDPEAGLAAARRAVALRPDHPPNVLALAEALAKTGDAHGAQDAYRRARELSQALPPSRDRDYWLREADQALGKMSGSH